MEQVTLGAVIFLIIKEVISSFRSNSKEQLKATQENTLALTKVQVELIHMQRALEALPKLRSDIDAAHHKIRELEKVGRTV